MPKLVWLFFAISISTLPLKANDQNPTIGLVRIINFRAAALDLDETLIPRLAKEIKLAEGGEPFANVSYVAHAVSDALVTVNLGLDQKLDTFALREEKIRFLNSLKNIADSLKTVEDPITVRFGHPPDGEEAFKGFYRRVALLPPVASDHPLWNEKLDAAISFRVTLKLLNESHLPELEVKVADFRARLRLYDPTSRISWVVVDQLKLINQGLTEGLETFGTRRDQQVVIEQVADIDKRLLTNGFGLTGLKNHPPEGEVVLQEFRRLAKIVVKKSPCVKALGEKL